MIGFLWPWVFLLLPLPLIARRLLPPARHPAGAALRVPFFPALVRAAGEIRPVWRSRRPRPEHLAWLLLVVAAAQPHWVRDPELIPTSGRDLMLVVDISGSMRSMDFGSGNDPMDRLTVVKQVAGRFLAERRGDRVGLVLFGAQPHLRAPLTHDTAAVRSLLDEAEVGLAGEHTAIGDAVGLALKVLRRRDSDGKVIVLLTDGVSNAGSVGPRQAARLAAREGVRIHTVGMGSDDAVAPNPLGTWGGGAQSFNRAVLEEMAQTTGGGYFHALDRAGLQEAYRRIDLLEPSIGEAMRDYTALQLYPWPLAAALAVTLWMAMPRRRRA